MSDLSLPFQLIQQTNTPNNTLPMNIACDGTGKFVAYTTEFSNESSSGTKYYYGNTYYSTDYGSTFNKMPVPSFSGCPYSPASNYIICVSLSVISATIGGVQQAYLMQSFSYSVPDASFNVPYSYLYFYGLNSSSGNAPSPNSVLVNSGLSTTFTSFSNVENVLVTSIINNNTSVNGQSFVFLVTQVYQNTSKSGNLVLNQWVCQFNPFVGNNQNKLYLNTYFTSYSPGAGYAFVINNNLATTQSTITLSPALTNGDYNSLLGIAYQNVNNDLSNYLIGPGNSTQILNSSNQGYYYLNLSDSSTTTKTYSILPTSPYITSDNIQMYNVCSNTQFLFLSNNLNYNSTSGSILANQSSLYVYQISALSNGYTPIVYNLQNTNGIVTAAAGYDPSKNAVYLPESIPYSSSGIYYNNNYTFNSPSSSFALDTGFSDPSYNYWISSCTNALGNYYYLGSSSGNGVPGYVYSIYNYLTTTVLKNGSNGYKVYPNSSNQDSTYNNIYTDFSLQIDPNTNKPYQYINVLVVGPGGNGYAQTSGETYCGGGGGGVAQAVNIPYFTYDSNGNSYTMTSLQIYVNSNESFVTCTYNNNSQYTLTITGNQGGQGYSDQGGVGGTALVTNNVSTIYNSTKNTVTQTGAFAPQNNKGKEGSTTTNTSTDISATGAVSGSTWKFIGISQKVKTTLYGTDNITFNYTSTGGGVEVNNNGKVTDENYAMNGGGGAGLNTNQISVKYSYGAYGFVCMWLTS